jgi:hypothetical protein
MRRADVRPGTVYGFYEGHRTSTHTTYAPVVVVTTAKYCVPRGAAGGWGTPRPAPDIPMRPGSWNKGACGFPAIRLTAQDASAEEILARAAEAFALASAPEGLASFTALRAALPGADHAWWTLVTSSGWLHGEYARLTARQEADRQSRQKAAAAAEAARVANLATARDQTARLEALGVITPGSRYLPDYATEHGIRLTFTEAEALITLAEKAAAETGTGEPQ